MQKLQFVTESCGHVFIVQEFIQGQLSHECAFNSFESARNCIIKMLLCTYCENKPAIIENLLQIEAQAQNPQESIKDAIKKANYYLSASRTSNYSFFLTHKPLERIRLEKIE